LQLKHVDLQLRTKTSCYCSAWYFSSSSCVDLPDPLLVPDPPWSHWVILNKSSWGRCRSITENSSRNGLNLSEKHHGKMLTSIDPLSPSGSW
jgi:hypothetical protein